MFTKNRNFISDIKKIYNHFLNSPFAYEGKNKKNTIHYPELNISQEEFSYNFLETYDKFYFFPCSEQSNSNCSIFMIGRKKRFLLDSFFSMARRVVNNFFQFIERRTMEEGIFNYQLMTNMITDFLFLINTNYLHISCNSAYIQFTQKTLNEVTALTVPDIWAQQVFQEVFLPH